eukprot:2569616-Pleurochrysis_carterae.AAC.6
MHTSLRRGSHASSAARPRARWPVAAVAMGISGPVIGRVRDAEVHGPSDDRCSLEQPGLAGAVWPQVCLEPGWEGGSRDVREKYTRWASKILQLVMKSHGKRGVGCG